MPAGNTYEAIATSTTSGSATSVVFSSIPGSYTDIIAVISGQVNSSSENITLRFNSDTGTNYSITVLSGNGSTTTSVRNSSQPYASVSYNTGGATTSDRNYIVQIQNYSNATTNKTFLSRSNAATGSFPGTEAIVGLWRSTAAITTITFGCTGSTNFINGTVISLYGIKAA